MSNNYRTQPVLSFLISAVLAACWVFPACAAGSQSKAFTASATGRPHAAGSSAPEVGSSEDPYFTAIYQHFYDTYRLGPGDTIAVRVVQQPDYSFDKVVVSPMGKIYHPLLGDVSVVGLTIEEVDSKLTSALSEYIRDPRVSVALIDANSAKVGVLGEVAHPGIVIISRPTTLLDAIAEAGGFTQFGAKGKVTLIRQLGGGRMAKREIDVKRILEAKANPEENVAMQAGDVIIVGQNAKAKLIFVAQLVGFGNFLAYLARF